MNEQTMQSEHTPFGYFWAFNGTEISVTFLFDDSFYKYI